MKVIITTNKSQITAWFIRQIADRFYVSSEGMDPVLPYDTGCRPRENDAGPNHVDVAGLLPTRHPSVRRTPIRKMWNGSRVAL